MFFKLFGNKKSNNEEHVESSVPTAVAATFEADAAQEAIPEPVQTVSAPPPAA